MSPPGSFIAGFWSALKSRAARAAKTVKGQLGASRRTNADLECDAIIFVTTADELGALKYAAGLLGVSFEERSDDRVATFYSLGNVGVTRVIAVRTSTGSHDFRGSAAQAVLFKTMTSAKVLIQLGMAFGIDPVWQKAGEVLVSTSIFPYDRREISVDDGQVVYKYDPDRTKRRNSDKTLVQFFERAREQSNFPFKIHFGMLLSGGARIYSVDFRNRLLRWVPTTPNHPIVGGEMEGVGLLSASDPQSPCWVVVKGISDFADKEHELSTSRVREIACRRAAIFVLGALLTNPTPGSRPH
jgi:nucleoside phosphorylase